MSERYDTTQGWNVCRDCGTGAVLDEASHDAFHDRIDRLAAQVEALNNVLTQAIRDEKAKSDVIEVQTDPSVYVGHQDPEPEPVDLIERDHRLTEESLTGLHADPCDCDDCREEAQAPLSCAVCGDPIACWGGSDWHHVPSKDESAYQRGHDHAATLTPPEPTVGSGWFADNWPGVLWVRDRNIWTATIQEDGGLVRYKPAEWPDLLPGRPAVPGDAS